MTDAKQSAAEFLKQTVLDNPYIPWKPTIQQAKFLLLPHKEAFYGGAAGGGKSVALLMCGLQFVQLPGYSALILRKEFPMMNQPGGLIDLSLQWLTETDAVFNQGKSFWTFPSGATLHFRHLQHGKDKYNFQGGQYQFVGFDELTQFAKDEYTYIFSRKRKTVSAVVPTRFRATANPGGMGHEWVKQRFITEGEQEGRPFIPAKLRDNQHLDAVDYVESLMELDATERRQLLHGDWNTRPPGDIFKPEYFEDAYIDAEDIPKHLEQIRYYDLASTELKGKHKKNHDPDFTGTCRAGRDGDFIYILHCDMYRKEPLERDVHIRRTAKKDGEDVTVWIEQDPGQAGKSQIAVFQRDTLSEFEVRGNPKTTGKMSYWTFLASKLEAGIVRILRAPWNSKLEDHLIALTRDDSHAHDDLADAVAGAVRILSEKGGGYASFAISDEELDTLLAEQGEGEDGDSDSDDFAFAFS